MAGTVLVVSPLLSLMRDQVEKLTRAMAKAQSGRRGSIQRSSATRHDVLSRLARRELDLLYVAPSG